MGILRCLFNPNRPPPAPHPAPGAPLRLPDERKGHELIKFALGRPFVQGYTTAHPYVIMIIKVDDLLIMND